MARAKIKISRSALLNNYRLLGRKVSHLKLLPMLKANAYGHGANYVAENLLKEKNLFGFGVATFQEAISLRASVKGKIPIIVFSDCAPWTEDLGKLCVQHQFQPVFSELVSLLTFQKSKSAPLITAHIEVNTGMNRLGIDAESLPLIRFQPSSIFTHLADADNPNSKLTKLQMKNFSEVVLYSKSRFPRALLHFGNSAAIWNHKQYPLTKVMDLARPGLSLYGIRPFEKAKTEGLKRVMRVTAPVINRLFLEKGEQVGYGGTYTCAKASGEAIAVIGAGYADGVFRSLSGKGIAYFKGKKLQFRGRVSMDLSAIESHSKIVIGDHVEIWGEQVDPYEQAHLAQTIPYELTTRIGERVERIYD